jgi:hypothetical protein
MIELTAVPCWVRWSEVNGFTPWRRALAIKISDPWLIVEWTQAEGGGVTVVPDHIVRGRVEMVIQDTKPGDVRVARVTNVDDGGNHTGKTDA